MRVPEHEAGKNVYITMKPKTKLIIWLVVGIILALGPVWGMVGTIAGMVMAFSHVQQGGMAEPELLANDMGLAMLTTLAGWIVCPIGVVIIIISAIRLGKLRGQPERVINHQVDASSNSHASASA